MFNSKGLSLAICTFGLVSSQLISGPQTFQNNGELSLLPEERSVNVLTVQLPQNKSDREPVYQIKPVYIPVPIKDIQANQLSYNAYQPNLFNYVPQQATATYQQPNSLQHISALPAKYPWTFATNEFSQAEYPNYVATPQKPVFFKNPETQLTQYPQFPQQNLNFTQSFLQFLPQLLNGVSFYKVPMTEQKILAEIDNLADNLKHDGSNKQMNNIIETNIRPSAKEPNVIIVPDLTLSTDNNIQNTKVSDTKKVTETNLLLQHLLQKISSQRRVQERIGAVYLRDSIRNRK